MLKGGRMKKIISFMLVAFFLVVFVEPIVVFAQETWLEKMIERRKQRIEKKQDIRRAGKCGDGICNVERGEYPGNCPDDCSYQNFYGYFEGECIKKGWNKITVDVDGIERKILWKGPEVWENGAIITLHGGGGTYSNFCSGIRIGKPMEDFGHLAVAEGFAVFSLDSGWGLRTDADAPTCGKRFDFAAKNNYENADLTFIEKVISGTISQLRPENSSADIFITGISTGGFMTTLAATHFDYLITAFAPVAAGDPYGAYLDCSQNPAKRRNAPGVVFDIETHEKISSTGACAASTYPNEIEWPSTNRTVKPPFKQFNHQGDALVDMSCKEKVQRLLVENGYKDDGSFIMENTGKKTVLKHLWMKEYNQPLIEFFKKNSKER